MRGFFNSAVQAKEEEDVAATNALIVEMALGGADLPEHASPPLPGGSVFSVAVRVEIEVRVQVDSVMLVDPSVGYS